MASKLYCSRTDGTSWFHDSPGFHFLIMFYPIDINDMSHNTRQLYPWCKRWFWPVGAKPLREPMLTYCQLDLGNKFQWNPNKTSLSRKMPLKMVWANCRPFCADCRFTAALLYPLALALLCALIDPSIFHLPTVSASHQLEWSVISLRPENTR